MSDFFGIDPATFTFNSDVRLSGMTNNGVIYGFVDRNRFGSSLDTDDNPIFFMDSSGMTIFGGIVGSTIGGASVGQLESIRMNDSGHILLRFNTPGGAGLALLTENGWILFVAPGSPGPGGRQFARASSLQLNEAGQVLIMGVTIDSNGAIWTGLYRREPDGALVTLTEERSNLFSTNLRSTAMNDRGEVAAVISGPFFSAGLFYLNSAGTQTRIAGVDSVLPGGFRISSINWATINGKGEVIFVASLSNGQMGVFIASPISATTVAGSIEGRSEELTTVTPGQTKIARVPLGSTLRLKFQKEDGTPLPSTFSLGTAVINPSIPTPTLFPNHVLIEFDRDSVSSQKDFRAVHLGNVALTIMPTDTAVAPITVSIQVVRPLQLGSLQTQFDDIFVEFGHQRGITPQLLKGLARRESGPNFRADAYRYEPFRDFFDISVGQNLLSQLPYSRYRLATADGLSQGQNLLSADISPRSLYFIKREGTLRKISDTDVFVSALEILQQNDSLLGVKDPSVPDQNWSARTSLNTRNLFMAQPNLLNFTAQTTLSASYGVMQLLYSTAIRPVGWTGLKVAGVCYSDPTDCNPSYLFDLPDNTLRGGGTVALASDYVRRKFIDNNPSISTSNPAYLGPPNLDQDYKNALKSYNLDPSYPSEVVDLSNRFLPVASGGIFQ
jgi:hypothetical protein